MPETVPETVPALTVPVRRCCCRHLSPAALPHTSLVLASHLRLASARRLLHDCCGGALDTAPPHVALLWLSLSLDSQFAGEARQSIQALLDTCQPCSSGGEGLCVCVMGCVGGVGVVISCTLLACPSSCCMEPIHLPRLHYSHTCTYCLFFACRQLASCTPPLCRPLPLIDESRSVEPTAIPGPAAPIRVRGATAGTARARRCVCAWVGGWVGGSLPI